jgi:hypothetical protein
MSPFTPVFTIKRIRNRRVDLERFATLGFAETAFSIDYPTIVE